MAACSDDHLPPPPVILTGSLYDNNVICLYGGVVVGACRVDRTLRVVCSWSGAAAIGG